MPVKIGIIGAGAAGLMAAKYALDAGASVTVIEKNEKAGKKRYITGKGRCNVTNACDKEDLMKNLVRNPRFLYASLACLDNKGLMRVFEELGKSAFAEADAEIRMEVRCVFQMVFRQRDGVVAVHEIVVVCSPVSPCPLFWNNSQCC